MIDQSRRVRRFVVLTAFACVAFGPHSMQAEGVDSKRDSKDKEDLPNCVTTIEDFGRDGDKFAVLISVNRYESAFVPRLLGCRNDMDALSRVLVSRHGFLPESILRLHGKAATRQGVLEGLKALRERAAAGKVVVFGYSGHGSYFTGAEESVEPDLQDETICPYDRMKKGDIRDDHLFDFFSSMLSTGAHVVSIVDACHSGSVFRGTPADREADDEDSATRLTEESPKGAPYEGSADDGGGLVGKLALNDRFVHLAACGDQQRARELTFRKGSPPQGRFGVFAHALVNVLDQDLEGRHWGHIQHSIRSRVEKHNRYQNPALVGNRRLEVFGTRNVTQRSSFLVRRVESEGEAIQLDQGRFSRIEEGAEIAVYKKGAHPLRGDKGRLAVYRVDQVFDTYAEATYLAEKGGQPKAVEEGCGFVVVFPGRAVKPLIVAVAKDLRVELSEQQDYKVLTKFVNEHPLLKFRGKDSDSPDFELTKAAPQGIRIKGPIATPGNSHVEREIDGVIDWLETSVRWDRLRRIDNPRINHEYPSGFKPEEAVEIRIERIQEQGDDVKKLPALPAPADQPSATRVRVGDRLQLSYRKAKDLEVFVSVVYLGNDGGIIAWNALKFEQVLKSNDFVSAEGLIKIGRPIGTDTVKVFVTTSRPYDVRGWEQSGDTRSPSLGSGPEDSIERWEDAVGVGGYRSGTISGLHRENWGTFELQILVED